MTIGLVLTIIFLVLKLVFHALDWPLWACFLPFIIEFGIEALIAVIWLAVFGGIGIAAFRAARRDRRARRG